MSTNSSSPAASLPSFEPATGLVVRGQPRRSWRDFDLLAFDMDSTLINIECVDEIADAAGRKAEVAAITEAAMRGEITDYKDSLRRRVALLARVPMAHLHTVWRDRLRLTPGAQALIDAAHAHGCKVLLVSGGFTFFSNRVRDALGIDFTRANVLQVQGDDQTGHLTGRLIDQPWGDICDGEEKRRTVLELASLIGSHAGRCMAVGDGANDLPMMRACHDAGGWSVAFHAKPAVREQARVSIESGGLDRLLGLLDE